MPLAPRTLFLAIFSASLAACGLSSTRGSRSPAPVVSPMNPENPDTPPRTNTSTNPAWLPDDNNGNSESSTPIRPTAPQGFTLPDFSNRESACELSWRMLGALSPKGLRLEFLLPNGLGNRIPIAGIFFLETEEVVESNDDIIQIRRTITAKSGLIPLNTSSIYPNQSELQEQKRADFITACQSGSEKYDPVAAAILLPPGASLSRGVTEQLAISAGTFNANRSRVTLNGREISQPFPAGSGTETKIVGEIEVWTTSVGLRVLELKSILRWQGAPPDGSTSNPGRDVVRELVSFKL
jgi:hypothetical protein